MARRLEAACLPAVKAWTGLAGTLVIGLMLSGCATVPDPADVTGSLSALGQDAPKGAGAARDYWATAYAKNPHDEKAAISFAHALKADGSKDKALSVLQQAAIYNPDSKIIAAEEGRLALAMGQGDLAGKLLNRANDPANPDWRVLNALGTLQAQNHDRAGAQGYFERAAQLAPNDPGVLNNLALCHALGGDPAKAEALLRKAMAAGGNTVRIRQNLALVLGVEGKYDEAQQLAATDLGKDQAEANRAYLQKMVAATPMSLGKHGKPDAKALASAWQTAVEMPSPTHPGSAKPDDSGTSAWVVDVASAPPRKPASVAALVAPVATLAPAKAKPWSLEDINVAPN